MITRFCICICLVAALLSAREAQSQERHPRAPSWLGYPVAFRFPETRWGAGAFASVQFAMDRSDTISPASQVQLGFAFTQNRQAMISAPFALFLKQRSRIIQGEMGYYDTSYPYFGIGYANDADRSERYEVRHLQFRAGIMERIRRNTYAGIRWWFDDYGVKDFPSGGLLDQTRVTGYSGSLTSSPGLILLLDSRDNVFQTMAGSYAEFSMHTSSSFTGSEYAFERYRIDLRKYLPTGASSSLALQGFAEMARGTVPFNLLPGIGGAKRMRGYYEGHFRDKNMLMVQGEWRTPVWKKVGLVLFAQSAVLSDEPSDFSTRYIKPAGGLGLRYMFDAQRRVNLRLDYAISREATLFYFTVGEAF